MKAEIKSVDGQKIVITFDDVISSQYGDCTNITVERDGEMLIKKAYIKKEEVKRVGKSL